MAIVAHPLSMTITLWCVAVGFCAVVPYFTHSQDVSGAFTWCSMFRGEAINALATG
ncbi:hypothetical protein ART_0336 [Arthrobacter sp. PAMC 25486]|nr:hypothetical protein ART_0336 [Arthrobacter sp. PAMC 25486]